MTNSQEFQNKVKAIKEKVGKTSIYIGRIPEKYKTEFKEIAREEFAEDYGLCLRELIRTWKGIFIDPNQELKIEIELLRKEYEEFKEHVLRTAQEKEQPDKGIRMLNGKSLKRRNEHVEIERPNGQTTNI